MIVASHDPKVRRIQRLRPYAYEHERSVREKAIRAGSAPSTLPSLVHWAATEWAREAPTAIAGAGVFVGRADPGEMVPAAELGGSLLGSPAEDPGFRRYMDSPPTEAHFGELEGHRVESDGRAYERPMHAALARLHGPRWAEPYTAAAHRLFALACVGFDLGAMVDRIIRTTDGCDVRIVPLAPYDAAIYWRGALTLWWERYADGPSSRPI